MDAGPGAHAKLEYQFPKGKPTWLLIRSSLEAGGGATDRSFEALKPEFAGKVNFIRMDWEAREALPLKEQFHLWRPPVSIVTGSDGLTREVYSGTLGPSREEIRRKLATVLRGEAHMRELRSKKR